MSDTMSYTGKLTVVECVCGITYAIPDVLYQQMRDQGPAKSIRCPLGCSWHYSKARKTQNAEAAKIRELERQLASSYDDTRIARMEQRAAENRARAQKAAKTKLKKRIAAGVCPCCQRSFQNLARHMAGQHPDFVEYPVPVFVEKKP